jgi:hypothetical protein
VSSLDYIHSDPSDDEYAELRKSMQKKKTKKAAARSTVPKINLSALQRAAAAHPAEGQFDSDTEGEDVGFVDQFGAIDLSKQDLKPDHASRPLWIDQAGNM